MIITSPVTYQWESLACNFPENSTSGAHLEHIWIPAQLNRLWRADMSDEENKIEQLKEKAAGTYPAQVLAYCTKSKSCQR